MGKILCILKKDYLALADKSIPNILDLINHAYYWVDRDHAETDESYLQIIPYLLVERQNDFGQLPSDFFMYRRLKKGKENRLHDNYSLGVGGHIDWERNGVSVYQGLPADDIVFLSAKEELNEEIELKSGTQTFSSLQQGDIVWMDPIYDDSNPVGRVHLGLVGIVSIYGSPQDAIVVREKEKLEGGLVGIEEVKDKYEQLENWSKLAWDMFREFDGQIEVLEDEDEDEEEDSV